MQPAGERDINQTAKAQAATDSHAGVSVSVETVLWIALLLAAAMLRLAALDKLPFTVDEAARSFDAFRVGEGDVPATWRGDLAAAASSYLFRIFGATEFVARTVPALAGIGFVGAIYWTRPYLGRTGALVAASLVTFSPLCVLYSRTATEYALGPLLSVILAVSLLEYLRSPRTAAAFPLIVSLALAPLTDAPAVLAALAVVVFVLLEATIFGNRDISRAWRAFRSSPVQWVSALLVLAAAVQLGVTHFGTSLDPDLPGVRLFADMFDAPRDSRPPEYHVALLLGYDWPLLVAGTAGFLLFAIRLLLRRPLDAFDRLLIIWTLVAAIALALITRREAGQLLIILPPLALLAGRLAREFMEQLGWEVVRRWWPAAATLVAVVAAATLLMTEWSSGNATRGERAVLAATPVACLVILAGTYIRSHSGAVAAGLTVVSLCAAAFVAHSSLAVAFGEGAEFAVDARLTPRAEQLKVTVDRLSVERNSPIVLDAGLRDELGWTLRDSSAIFGGQIDTASILVTRPDAAPSGFAGLPDVWRVSEGWYPDEVLAPRRMWRWLLYREPFGAVEAVEVRIYVRTV